MKITIESNNETVDFNPAALFEYDEEPLEALAKPKKTSIEWRPANPNCNTFVNDQIIEDADPATWTINYYMAKSPISRHVFRVPADNRPFIEEAIRTGCLKRGVAYDITIESDSNKLCRWIKIEEI